MQQNLTEPVTYLSQDTKPPASSNIAMAPNEDSTADSALMPPPPSVPPAKQEGKKASPPKEERRPLSGMLPPKYKGAITPAKSFTIIV